MDLPSNPFLDVVSFVFSHCDNGVSVLVDSLLRCFISYLKLPLVKFTALIFIVPVRFDFVQLFFF